MRCVVVLALMLASACEASECVGTCEDIRLVPMSLLELDLASGDIDGDGRRDIVAAGGFGVSVRWGAPEGLSLATRWATSAWTHGVRLGDVDADGRVDLVVMQTSGTVAWLRGIGSRMFAPAQDVELGASAGPFVLADVDGDGDDDLVFAENEAARLHLLPGGSEGFGPRRPVTIGGEAVALVAGDFTGDGAAEVVAAVPARGRVEMLYGATDEPLAYVTIARSSGFPQAVTAADLDGDGALDLAIGDALDPSVWIGLGDGQGGWSSEQLWPAFSEPWRLLPRRGADGLELAVIASDRRGIALLDRAGTLRTTTRTEMVVGVAAFDLDGDGRDELVSGSEVPGVVREVDGFQPVPRWRWPLAGEAGRVALADLDGDGKDEFVVEDVERAALVAFTPADQGLAELARTPLVLPLGGLVPLALGDGREVLARWEDPRLGGLALEVLSYEPGEGFAVAARAELGVIGGAIAADVDGDGRQELVVRAASLVPGGLLLPDALNILRWADDDSLTVQVVEEVQRPRSISAADHDGDGRDTVWVLDSTDHLLEVSESADAWAVTSKRLPFAGYGPVAWADVDGDGAPEQLLCGGLGLSAVADGESEDEVVLEPIFQGRCSGVQACDVDADGIVELVLTRDDSHELFQSDTRAAVEILRARPEGWASAGSFQPSEAATAIVAQCEADGLEMASAGPLGAALSSVTPGPALYETAGAAATPTAVGDLDGDGLEELVAGSRVGVMLASPDGDRGYGPVRTLPLPVAEPLWTIVPAAFDDRPGAELLVTYGGAGKFTWAVWALREGRLVELATLPSAGAVLGDFDGDGRDELLQWHADGLRLAWPLPRSGEPALVPVTLAGDGATVLASGGMIADADGDGRADVLNGRRNLPEMPGGTSLDTLWVVRSAGSAEFEAPREWTIAGDWSDARFGDVDADGVLELLFVNRDQSLVACTSDSHGGPGGACRVLWTIPEDASIDALTVGDVDRDGIPDIIALIHDTEQRVIVLRDIDGRRVVGSAWTLPPLAVHDVIVPATVRPGSRAWVVLGSAGAVVIGGGP